MHHFFIPSQNLTDRQAILTGEQARQVALVLRLRPGERLVALDNTGWEYEVRLTAVSRDQVMGDVVDRRTAVGEPTIHLTLYIALLKREKFEWVLQKGTEVGVSRFVPVITQRTLAQDTEIKAGKQERWQKILTEAAEQCRRGRIPALAMPTRLADALAQHGAEMALIPWEEERGVGLKSALSAALPASIALFIGPEGGFAPEEIALARQHHVQPVTLGRRILRAETAALVAASLLIHEVGDMA
ncbi:MAG: 16S rRNA (uracil(1498)-N(3))-methyltransferase [Chloroflexi bacterium]|nr:16S rRNA (uracil(1498)-N(3))-methyltransferase [Ardenticatenaceae bacterium]MBL1131506.1 16S rRNA (uracil(1498)-N(3))-methyltransferase [Chloroflexota bacterium]NOG37617.1 16S rRNA (uracil(1498)-N(3))-methyltransferase [Chloroflexota bacterium]GIK55595.1 MAG: ribosomal RNA small subunit methyltransferase E [Chloroflexota bacterium]